MLNCVEYTKDRSCIELSVILIREGRKENVLHINQILKPCNCFLMKAGTGVIVLQRQEMTFSIVFCTSLKHKEYFISHKSTKGEIYTCTKSCVSYKMTLKAHIKG